MKTPLPYRRPAVFGRIPASILAKLLAAFLAIAAMLVAVGAASVIGLAAVNDRFENVVQLQRKIAAYRQIQFDTLLFFLGILLLVGALKEVGVLVLLTELYLQVDPTFSSFLMGIISSVLDNVPLTAALLKAEPELSHAQWLSLAYAVGIGGSMLVIGSAAGIVAMSKVRELTFMQYAKYAPHIFAAYAFGYGLTLLF